MCEDVYPLFTATLEGWPVKRYVCVLLCCKILLVFYCIVLCCVVWYTVVFNFVGIKNNYVDFVKFLIKPLVCRYKNINLSYQHNVRTCILDCIHSME